MQILWQSRITSGFDNPRLLWSFAICILNNVWFGFVFSHYVKQICISHGKQWGFRTMSHGFNKMQVPPLWSPSQWNARFFVACVVVLMKYELLSWKVMKSHITIMNIKRNSILLTSDVTWKKTQTCLLELHNGVIFSLIDSGPIHKVYLQHSSKV